MFLINSICGLTALSRRIKSPLRGIGHHGGVFLGLCGIAVLWAGVFHSLAAERRQAIQAATDNVANLCRAFEEQIIRSIGLVDQSLLYVREARAKNADAFKIYDWARDTRLPAELSLQISLIDPSGWISGTSLYRDPPPVNAGDRAYFKVHSLTSPDVLYINEPLVGRGTGKPMISMSRKLVNADGSFGGVVAVSLDAEYLSRFYNSVDLGATGAISVVGTDGVIRARAAAGGPATGQPVAGTGLLRQLAAGGAGTFQATSPIDHVHRIYAYRAVRSYPLIVFVGVGEDEVLANYQVNRRSYLLVASALTLLMLPVIATIVLHQAGMRRTQERLRESEANHARKSAMLEAAVENMSQGIIMVGADRRVQVWNNRALRKLGVPEPLMASRPFLHDLLRWLWEHGEYGETSGDFETWLRDHDYASGTLSDDHVIERTRPNGQVLEIRSTPLSGGGLVRTFTDVTLRKAAETALRDARDQSDRAARSKSEFLAMMSHEIRSPMSGMLGIIELLRETKLDAEQAGMAELALESATSLLRILNDVLDFSKIEAGAVGISPEPTAIRELLRVLAEPAAVVAARKGLRLALSVADDVPDWITVDPLRLRQILGNLLGNAVKFTAAGSVELAVSCAGGASLTFAVSDSGIGMAPESLQRLFEPFMQEDASTAKTFGGTGLGLSISRRLARLLGGDIAVTSTRGAGSVFSLTVPLVVAAPVDAAPDLGAFEPEGDGLRGIRVLAAEDQSVNRWLMTRQLSRLGVLFEIVEDGRQALAAMQAGRFDLLLTDCHMPGMDGIELTARVRAKEARDGTARMPVIGLTADITTDTKARCVAAGMDEIVAKPINLRDLEQLLCAVAARQAVRVVPTASTPDDPLFDAAPYSEYFDGEPHEGEAWLDAYIGAATSEAQSVIDSALAGDRKGVQAAAHRLAGSSLSVGAARLGLLARALENAAPDAALPELREMAEGIAAARDAAFAAIGAFAAGLKAPAG